MKNVGARENDDPNVRRIRANVRLKQFVIIIRRRRTYSCLRLTCVRAANVHGYNDGDSRHDEQTLNGTHFLLRKIVFTYARTRPAT